MLQTLAGSETFSPLIWCLLSYLSLLSAGTAALILSNSVLIYLSMFVCNIYSCRWQQTKIVYMSRNVPPTVLCGCHAIYLSITMSAPFWRYEIYRSASQKWLPTCFLKCSSLLCTRKHVFVALDKFDVLFYRNYKNLSCCSCRETARRCDLLRNEKTH